MQWKLWIAAVALGALAGATPAGAGGAGPLEIDRLSGRVEIQPLDDARYWGEKSGSVGRVGRWRPAGTGQIVGKFLLRTGPRSYAYLGGKRWCLDPNSLIEVESAADFGIVVVRGKVSAADGKPGRGLFREYRSDTREGVIR